ncbi:MAG: glycosyltransferase [Phycisphaerales bacterium]|nr:MAG: glycosyltransferase [Phycisphaerales bacterium]
MVMETNNRTDGSLRISFILPVLNETYSLRQTVDTIFELARADLHEALIITAERTTPESLVVVETIKKEYGARVRVHKQTLPFLGGAMQEAFEIASGEHVMLMASDLETDPAMIPAFIDKVREGCWDIVAASRWLKGGGFEGYSKTKLILNYLFQKIFRILYRTTVTDLTYAYRLYRKSVLEPMRWEELKHPFLLECLLKPLRCGARITEIPCTWRARTEGTSAGVFIGTFAYLRIALKTRFVPAGRLRKKKRQ